MFSVLSLQPLARCCSRVCTATALEGRVQGTPAQGAAPSWETSKPGLGTLLSLLSLCTTAGDTSVPPAPVCHSWGHSCPSWACVPGSSLTLAMWMEKVSGLLMAESTSYGKTPSENKTWRRCWLQFSRSTKEGHRHTCSFGSEEIGEPSWSRSLFIFQMGSRWLLSPMICLITSLHELCLSSCNSQLFRSPPARGDRKQQRKMSQDYRGIGVGLDITLNRTTPAAAPSYLCYCIQHFLALCSRQASFTLVNGILISLNLPEVVPGLFWGKPDTGFWKTNECFTLRVFTHDLSISFPFWLTFGKMYLSDFLNSNQTVCYFFQATH